MNFGGTHIHSITSDFHFLSNVDSLIFFPPPSPSPSFFLEFRNLANLFYILIHIWILWELSKGFYCSFWLNVLLIVPGP